ncbi:30S ribosomal protein S4 [Simkania negevensis]|uniref:Small ribosomal subunit protein uS4 n=1 Tax=Simkania negevensis TaxID=83561 RepID=A0ABS3ARN3_9BACT|nr:30S ribosomal protein S4 [Simkania negevensis]
MVRYLDPKNRVARRFGVNIFGRARNPLLHKQNPPGVHGARRPKKSDYGLQLEEKQKLRAAYGMLTQKQLLGYYRKAVQQKGAPVENFLRMLESRLDVVVYRLKLAPTLFAAHQLVSHGHILVDGKKVDIRSFQVKPGMAISIKEKSRKMPLIQNALQGSSAVPEYLTVNVEKSEGKMESVPMPDQIPLPIEVNVPVVCEFLAHTS